MSLLVSPLKTIGRLLPGRRSPAAVSPYGRKLTGSAETSGKKIPLEYTSYSNSESLSLMRAHPSFKGVIEHAEKEGKKVYCQQMGLREPTFLTVIGPSKAMEDKYPYFDFSEAVRYILTDCIWLRSVVANMVIDLDYIPSPTVYVDRLAINGSIQFQKAQPPGTEKGPHLFIDTVSARTLAEQLVPRLIDNYGSRMFTDSEKVRNESKLTSVPFFSQRLRDLSIGPLYCGRIRKQKMVAVCGKVHRAEAGDLLEELRSRQAHNILKAGHILINYGYNSFTLEAENPDAPETALIKNFIEGFNTRIALSDTHLGNGGPADNFGKRKAGDLLLLLDRLIACRGVLVINGDFLDLWQSKYGDIKRFYPDIVDKMRLVRKIIYVAGNHDEDILQERSRRKVTEAVELARKNSLEGTLKFTRRKKRQKCDFTFEGVDQNFSKLKRLIDHPDMDIQKERLVDLAVRISAGKETGIPNRSLCLCLSRGFEDIAALRSPGSHVLYLDVSLLEGGDDRSTAEKLYSVIFDAFQDLPGTIHQDFGRISIISEYFDWPHRTYYEHGHQADIFNFRSAVGRNITRVVGWLEKAASLVHWISVERDLGKLEYLPEKIWPSRFWRGYQYAERAIALSKMFEWYEMEKTGGTEGPFTIIFGHTHFSELRDGTIHHFVNLATGKDFGNTGTWSGFRQETDIARPGDWKKKPFSYPAKRREPGASLAREDWLMAGPGGRLTRHDGTEDAKLIDT